MAVVLQQNQFIVLVTVPPHGRRPQFQRICRLHDHKGPKMKTSYFAVADDKNNLCRHFNGVFGVSSLT